MLRPHTSTVPYEGWSGAYSATSILMQLQSFLFAEKIDQDGGYQANAKLSNQHVTRSLKVCKKYKCRKCSHSHDNPWPKVKGPPEALIKVYPTDPESERVVVQGSSCQTTYSFVQYPSQSTSKTHVSVSVCDSEYSILGRSSW